MEPMTYDGVPASMEPPMNLEYTVADDKRLLVGLNASETAEFERLDAQIPFDAKPVWPDTANSPAEERWLNLYRKHELARQAPHRRFGGRKQLEADRPQVSV
jgi:hypothetical protein